LLSSPPQLTTYAQPFASYSTQLKKFTKTGPLVYSHRGTLAIISSMVYITLSKSGRGPGLQQSNNRKTSAATLTKQAFCPPSLTDLDQEFLFIDTVH
jgi:hypothetical protein